MTPIDSSKEEVISLSNTPQTAIDSFNNLILSIDTRIKFKQYTMEEWSQQLVNPMIPEPLEREDVLKLNQIAVHYSEIVYRNTAIAKGVFTGAKSNYTKKFNLSKEKILKDIEEYNNNPNVTKAKKIPSSDLLETLAANLCIQEAQTLTMAELFYDFWKLQVDKLQLFNSRLTSLNISKHQEEKYSNF